MPVVQVIIDDSTSKTVTGQHDWDRDSGGVICAPSGTSFPGTPVAKEWFWRSDESKLYRRNDANTAWDAVVATASAHDLGGSSHNADTLANLNSKILGATLDDSGDPRTPTSHSSTHENGGGDEISVAGLSGLLADNQNPATHVSSHEPGGGDALTIDAAAGTGSLRTLGTGAQQACAGNDSRLSDNRNDSDAIHDNVSGEINVVTEKALPVSADVLLIEDSEATYSKKRVQVGNLPGGGGGESNTASNVGTAGIGIFKQKAGVDLEFKKINAGSSKVTVTDDTGNDEVDVDIVEAQIDHGSIGGLGDDDHSQYHNDTRGDARYYQKTEFIQTSVGAGDAGKPVELDAAGHIDASMINDSDVDHTNIGSIGTNTHAQIDTHLASTSNPHSVTAAQAGAASSPHALGSSDHSADTLANLNTKISDATLDDSSATRDPNAHGIAGAAHSADTLANLNLKISDATLDDSSSSRTPTSHASSHQNGGGDEISVAGLSGTLADPQTPSAHALGGSAHSTDTLANLNSKISDATLDDSSSSRPPSGSASGDLGGTYPSPTVNDGADSTAIHDNVTAEINAITEKASPIGADVLLIEDSAASYAKKRVQITNLPGGADSDAIHDNVAGEIALVTEKATPVSADLLLIEDSADSNNKKRVQVGNLPGGGGGGLVTKSGSVTQANFGANNYCTVTFTTAFSDTDYSVFLSASSTIAVPIPFWRTKTTTTFRIYLHDSIPSGVSFTIDWMCIERGES